MSELKLDVDQASEIKAMARRERGSDGSEWTNEKLKTLCESRGLFGQVLDVLEGRAEIVMKKVAPFVEKAKKVVRKLTTWLRAKVGGLTREQLIEKLDNVPIGDTGLVFRVSDYAKDLMTKSEFVVAQAAQESDFAIATPADLGFTANPTTEQLFDEANLAKYGLELCKPDDGPSLRLAYTNQPNGEWLPIAMKPILASGGGLGVFSLERGGSKLWLHGDCGVGPQRRWDLGGRLVFRFRKNTQN